MVFWESVCESTVICSEVRQDKNKNKARINGIKVPWTSGLSSGTGDEYFKNHQSHSLYTKKR